MITYDNISYIIIHPIPISFPSEPSPSGTSCRGWWSWAVPLWAAAPASRRCSRPRRWRSPGQRGCRASVVFSGSPPGGLGVLKTSWERYQWEAVTSSTIWFCFSRNLLEVLLFSNKWLQMGQIQRQEWRKVSCILLKFAAKRHCFCCLQMTTCQACPKNFKSSQQTLKGSTTKVNCEPCSCVLKVAMRCKASTQDRSSCAWNGFKLHSIFKNSTSSRH